MSRTAKFLYFILALCVMACFAYASLLMANGRPGAALALFVVAFVVTGAGFVMKRRVMKK